MPKPKKDIVFEAIESLQKHPKGLNRHTNYTILFVQCETEQQQEILASVELGQTHPSCLYELFGYEMPNEITVESSKFWETHKVVS